MSLIKRICASLKVSRILTIRQAEAKNE